MIIAEYSKPSLIGLLLRSTRWWYSNDYCVALIAIHSISMRDTCHHSLCKMRCHVRTVGGVMYCMALFPRSSEWDCSGVGGSREEEKGYWSTFCRKHGRPLRHVVSSYKPASSSHPRCSGQQHKQGLIVPGCIRLPEVPWAGSGALRTTTKQDYDCGGSSFLFHLLLRPIIMRSTRRGDSIARKMNTPLRRFLPTSVQGPSRR